MRDPLQVEPTPYEVLGVDRGADGAAIDAAFKTALARGVAARTLVIAKQTLQRPDERALLDLFLYEPESLRLLSPSPLDDESVLQGSERALTALAWEEQVQAEFPHLPAAHSLAVLWYWWAVHAQARPDGSETEDGAIPTLVEMWELAIGYWCLLLASPGFWADPRTPRHGLRTELARRVEERLRSGLDAGEERRRAAGDGAGAARYEDLRLALGTERRAADELSAAGIRVGDGRASCGPILLRQLGLLSGVSRAIEAALRNDPDDARLGWLRQSISPLGPVAALLDGNKPEAALEALDAARADLGDSAELRDLQARALLSLGRKHGSLGRAEQALAVWEEALEARPSERVASQVRSQIASTSRERAAALAHTRLGEAIALLERAHGLADDAGVRETLAEFVTRRGVETFNAALGDAEGTDRDGMIASLERSLADLDRGAKLGSESAREQAETVRGLLQQAKAGVLGAPTELAEPLARAGEAAERGDWDTAVTSFEQALEHADGDAQETVRKNLAVCLTNRATARSNRAMKKLAPDSEDRKRLLALEAAAFFSGKGGKRGGGREGRRWRPRLPKLSFGGAVLWLVALSFVWLPLLLLGLGAITEEAAGSLSVALLVVVWITAQFLIPLAAWLWSSISSIPTFDARTGTYGSSGRNRSSEAEGTCDVEGCSSGAYYEIDLASILGAPSLEIKKRLCATHASELERALDVVPVDQDTFAALTGAKSDLQRAAALDPGEAAVAANLRELEELLKRVRVAPPKPSSRRSAGGGRATGPVAERLPAEPATGASAGGGAEKARSRKVVRKKPGASKHARRQRW